MFLLIQIAALLVTATADAGPSVGQPQTDVALPLVAGDGYQGVIFPAPPFNLKASHGERAWAPSVGEVREFEQLLRTTLEAAIRDPRSLIGRTCQTGESEEWCAEFQRRRKDEIKSVLERLDRYRNQYAGIAMGNRRTLVVNFFPVASAKGRDWHPTWRREWVYVLGGGTSYWGISFDVQEKRFHDFYANSPR